MRALVCAKMLKRKKKKKYKSREGNIESRDKMRRDSRAVRLGTVTRRQIDDQHTLNFNRISLFHKNEVTSRDAKCCPNGDKIRFEDTRGMMTRSAGVNSYNARNESDYGI